MEPILISEIINATGGKLINGDENQIITSVTTNSNNITKDSLFVPIVGSNVDAHLFIEDSLNKGCSASLTQVDKKFNIKNKSIILVNDTKEALQSLAKWYRQKFSIPVIGITGSTGKTSTKDMIASALSFGKNVLKTKGNQNSQIGLPLTIFNIENKHEVALVEMGISLFGEMEKIVEIAKPTSAVIINIGLSHIENLHTQINILNEKLQIIKYIKKGGKLFLNGDDKLLVKLKDKLDLDIVFFGKGQNCLYRAEEITSDGTTTQFKLITPNISTIVNIPALGEHNVMNSLAGIAIASDLGLDIDIIKSGIQSYKKPKMRGEVYDVNGVKIIDDSYNSSPDAIKSSVDVLELINCDGRRILVVADILELGEISKEVHYGIGEYIAFKKIDCIISIGENAKEIAKGARDNNCNIFIKTYDNNIDAYNFLNSYLKKGDAVLIKGSRGMKTEEIVNKLTFTEKDKV